VRPRALVLDFNGTLSLDEPILCAVYRELFAEQGRPLEEAVYYELLAGRSEEAIIGSWLGIEGEELARLAAERVRRYRERAADGSTVPERHRRALRYAAARVPLVVVSGAFRREIEDVLAAAGLLQLFRHLISAEDVVKGKPDPEGYLLALQLLRLPPQAVLALEDSEAGVAAAKQAGLACLAVRGTASPQRLRHADGIVERIDVALMRRLLG
jgi:beta-phosphoglucomutase